MNECEIIKISMIKYPRIQKTNYGYRFDPLETKKSKIPKFKNKIKSKKQMVIGPYTMSELREKGVADFTKFIDFLEKK